MKRNASETQLWSPAEYVPAAAKATQAEEGRSEFIALLGKCSWKCRLLQNLQFQRLEHSTELGQVAQLRDSARRAMPSSCLRCMTK